MSAQILNGKVVRDHTLAALRERVEKHVAAGGRRPGLAVILVGDDPASQIYVGSKRRACEKVGIQSFYHGLAAAAPEEHLLRLIDHLNDDALVDGILVQLPLPVGIDPDNIINRIRAEKDVDGFLPANVGALAINKPRLSPCTPRGVISLLRYYGVEMEGREAVVIGASRIVGRPMMLELLNARATATVCNSRTPDLAALVERADLVVAAAGRKHLVKGEWIKKGAVVVDVGIHRNADGTLCGDVDFGSARMRSGWISPVPGGVGPMTITTLMQNTVQAAGLLQGHHPAVDCGGATQNQVVGR